LFSAIAELRFAKIINYKVQKNLVGIVMTLMSISSRSRTSDSELQRGSKTGV